MRCPICGAEMTLHEGEDEKSDGRIYPYAHYLCPSGHVVHDYEDEFVWPEEKTP